MADAKPIDLGKAIIKIDETISNQITKSKLSDYEGKLSHETAESASQGVRICCSNILKRSGMSN